MKIEFSGKIAPELEQDIRPVYFGEPPWQKPFFYGLFVVVTAWVVCYWLNVDLIETVRFLRIQPVNSTYSLSSRLSFVGLILLTFYLAFLRLPHWWSWWWKRSKSLEFSGAVDELGIHVDPTADGVIVIPWNRFQVARIGSQAVYLPIRRADGLVFHRTFFQDAADWDKFIALLASSGLRRRSISSAT